MIASINNKWDRLDLLLSEILMNTLIRYLVLSETTIFVYARNRLLFRTIRDDHIFRLLMWVYNIDSPIIPNENRWTFSDFRSIHSSLAEYLWGVCFCALHGCAYWIDRWCRCACVGAYCIRPPYHSQRKQMNVFRFQVYTFIPCGIFVGRMLLRPTWIRVFVR